LARVPENSLKFGVGVILTSFGMFWTGEGLGIAWPGRDPLVPLFGLLFFGLGRALAASFRRPRVIRL
jgi:uncharacterized membrane protein